MGSPAAMFTVNGASRRRYGIRRNDRNERIEELNSENRKIAEEAAPPLDARRREILEMPLTEAQENVESEADE